MRLERLLAIVVKFLNRDRISAHELAQEFEVTIRTIYRDIDAINMAGIPIVSFPGQQGGFGVMESFRLDRQVLTLPEIASILNVLRGFQGTFSDRKVATAAEKIKSMLPNDKKKEVEARVEQIVIKALPWGENPKQKRNLALVQQAVSNGKLLKCVYQNAKGERRSRVVEPMTLIYQTYVWYLFAYCRLKKNYRFFRLTRMNQIHIQPETFVRRNRSYKEFELKENPVINTLVDLKLRFSSDVQHRIEDTFDPDHVQYRKDGTTEIRVKWPDDLGLYMFLLSFGEHLQVIDPPHVRTRLLEMAQKVCVIYK